MSKTGEALKTGKNAKYSRGLLFTIVLALPLVGFLLITNVFAATGPLIGTLGSSTHPVEDNWYSNNDPTFSWSSAQDLVLSGTTSLPGKSYGLDESDGLVYSAQELSGLGIVQMVAGSLVKIGELDTPGAAWDVAVYKKDGKTYALVADGSQGLRVIDVSDPANPVFKSVFDTPGNAYGVAVSGEHAYVADNDKGLQIINLSNPDSPVWKGWVDSYGNARAVAVEGNYAYLADSGAGLVVVDVSDPASPLEVGKIGTGSEMTGIAVADQYAYLAARGAGLFVVNVSDPAAPFFPEADGYNLDLDNSAQGVTISGTYALVAFGNIGLQVVNIDPAHHEYLTVKSSYDTPGFAREVIVTSDYIYLADQSSLKAFRIKKPDAYSYVLDSSPATEPDTVSEGAVEYANLSDVGDGAWYFHVKAKDEEGNWGPAAHRAVKIDGSLPSTTSDVPGAWQTSDFTINFNCSDSVSGCRQIMINSDAGADQYTHAASAAYDVYQEGDHVMNFRSEDNAGNLEAIQTIHARLDKTPPHVSSVSYDGPYADGSAAVNAYYDDALSGIDTGSVSLMLDVVTLGGCTVTEESIHCPMATLALGDHEVEVKLRDIAGNEITEFGIYPLEEDHIAPVTATNAPAGWVNSDFDLEISCTDNASGCKRIGVKINGSAYQYTEAASAAYLITPEGDNSILHYGEDKKGNIESVKTAHVKIDRTPPAIFNIRAAAAEGGNAAVMAYYSDTLSGIDAGSAAIAVYGDTPLTGCLKTDTYISCPVTDVPASGMPINVQVSDSAGNARTVSGNAMLTRDYLWTWYDSVYMKSWILMANRKGGSQLNFSLSVGGYPMGLQNQGVVTEGAALTPNYPGIMDGPVKATSMNGSKAIVSQRSLMGNSFEEVLGTDIEQLSDHFYWSWYDMASPGFRNWILVSNPSGEWVHAVITFKNQADGALVTGQSDIAPGENWNAMFPGRMGGPVEVKATRPNGDWDVAADRRDVMASQRVISNFGQAFNEVPGIPAEQLKDEYMWTWYDMQSPGYRNWVLIANPGLEPVNYELEIAGVAQYCQGGCTIPGGGMVTPIFPGVMNGPVKVKATDGEGAPASVIASQRITAGPSFEEVPGYPQDQLTDDYHWTWYDMTGGFTNWILIANAGNIDATYEIRIAGVKQNCGACTIPPDGRVTPLFPGIMNGPVEVISTNGQPIMVSQRVTRFGFFNEVLGTVLD